MELLSTRKELKSKLVINSLSIAIPVAVVVILGFPNKLNLGDWTKSLAHVIGAVNTLTTVFLIAGFIFIKREKIHLHRIAMLGAFALGGVFLICYILYHISNPANRFNGEGAVRFIYFFFLISHIALSLVVLPLVLRALFYALTRQIGKHKKIVKYAYPIWLYVSASGVIVYLLLYQLFPNK